MDQSENEKMREAMKMVASRLVATSSFYYQSVPLGREQAPHEVYHPHVAMGVAINGDAIPLAHEADLEGLPLNTNRMLKAMLKAAEILATQGADVFRSLDIVAVACIFEAWVVEKRLDKGGAIPAAVLSGPSPEHHPDRKETLNIHLVSVGGDIKATTMLLIERPTGMRPTLREWKPLAFYDPRNPQPGDWTFMTTEGDLKRPPDSPLH